METFIIRDMGIRILRRILSQAEHLFSTNLEGMALVEKLLIPLVEHETLNRK